jgi:hypothetical protein
VSCPSPLPFESLLAWWLGELPEADEAALEEHLLACAHCARRGEELTALAAGVRAAVRSGAVGLMVSALFVERMREAGLRLREYRLAAGETVNCTLRVDEDAVVGRMRAPLAGVTRLDALQRLEVGGVEGPEVRVEDVPFDPSSGEVLFVPMPAALKKMPAHTMRVRLVALGAGGEAVIGDYAFAHTLS